MHPLKDSKILVVEDDTEMCESIRALLTVHGFDVQTRTTLPDAQNALKDVRYDLVLLDLKLKDQCGFNLMDALVDGDTRVIVITGQHSEAYAITAIKKGVTDYLKKPFEPDALIESVNAVLNRQRHRRELELLQYAINTSSVAIGVGDSGGIIIYTNTAYRRLMHAEDGINGQPSPPSPHGNGYTDVDPEIRKALESGIPWNGIVELVDARGNAFEVCKRIDPIPERIAGDTYGVALMCDMTTQLEKERVVAKSRERYRKVIDSQQEFVYRLNADLILTFVNQAYASYRGARPQSMIGMPITAFVPESIQPRVVYALDAIQSDSEPVEIELSVTDTSGKTRWQQWRFEGIRDANGDLTELQAVGRDISNRKRTEIRLQEESQRLKQALARVKRLSGMLPICARCKKIRDDMGYWNNIEDYIENNSDAEFSHGICPECARQLYPELYE